jgi:DNA-binding CsgD family transcriptional regulator
LAGLPWAGAVLRDDIQGPDIEAAVDDRDLDLGGFTQLTPRECEVLQLIVRGRSAKEAGRALGISPRTVEGHRASVMEKLGARNVADLVRIVLTG